MPKQILLTAAGYEKLKRELEELKGPIRRQIADAIREAKSHGDLRENAAYHEAKLNQSRIEGRAADLEKVLQYAKIVERPDCVGECAHLGSKVTLNDESNGASLTVTLVGSFEADPTMDLISITSPLGSSLLGKGVGDEVEIEAPAGLRKYRVLAVD